MNLSLRRTAHLKSPSRLGFITGSASALAFAAVAAPAKAAQFEFRCGDDLAPDHPSTIRLTPMWKNIAKESGGRMNVGFFPNGQLGGAASMLTQLRSGGIHFMLIAPGVLQGLVPACDITNVGLAFKDEDEALHSLDGPLGDYVRKEIEGKGIYAFRTTWNSGMRQITSSSHPIRSVDDMTGFKIRVVESRITVDFFKTLGASPVPLSLGELYTALQTKVVDGEDSPLATIQASRFYEVQKYLSMTNHSWSGNWLLANAEVWKSIPADLQQVIEQNNTRYARLERQDSKAVNASVGDKLGRQGLIVNKVDASLFRARLRPYYQQWATNFGPTEWGLLQNAVSGKLV